MYWIHRLVKFYLIKDKTNKGEKNNFEEVSTTLPLLNYHSAIKNQKIKNPISNFELQKEISKKSKLKTGNEFDNINIINDSQYLFGESLIQMNNESNNQANNITSIKDNQFSISNVIGSDILTKRDDEFLLGKRNFNILNNNITNMNVNFNMNLNLKKINKENNANVAQKWGKDNQNLNNLDQESLDLVYNSNSKKNKKNKIENESFLIFKGKRQCEKNSSINIINDYSNLNQNDYAYKNFEYFPKGENFEFGNRLNLSLKETNIFNTIKDNVNSIEINDKNSSLSQNSSRIYPNELTNRKNNYLTEQDINKKTFYSPINCLKSKIYLNDILN